MVLANVALNLRLMALFAVLPMAAFDFCNLYTTLNESIFQPLAIVGALIAAAYFGLAKVLSFFMPEIEGKVRQIPKNVIIGFASFAVGPWLVLQLVSTFGLKGATC